MSCLSEDNKAYSKSTTTSFIEGPVKIIINWDIPNFSTLKEQKTELESKVSVVGSSAWSILLVPSDDFQDSVTNDTQTVGIVGPSVGIDLKRECLGNDISDVQAFFELSLTDDADQRHVILGKERIPDTFRAVVTKWGDSCIKHADLWGPNPKYILKNDTLKIRAEIQYVTENTELKDPVEPLTKRLCAIHDSKFGRDFRLVSSVGTKYAVHRAILSASSPVFYSMLHSGMAEANTGLCTMPDVSNKTLFLMVKFMYENSKGFLRSISTNKDVLIAADKYQMADLKEVCEKLLVADLSNENATDLLILADMVSARILKVAALDHVAKNLQAMTSSGQLKELTESGNSTLLQEVFTAVAQHGTQVTGSAKKVTGNSNKRKTTD